MRWMASLTLASTAAFAAAAQEKMSGGWSASSTLAPGTVVAIAPGQLIERVPIRPVEVVRTAEDLLDLKKGKVILPAGALLVRMTGGDGQPRFCTWNHGKAFVTPAARSALTLGDFGALLCAVRDSSSFATQVNFVSASSALLLRPYTFDFAGNPKRTNPVALMPVASDAYRDEISFGPLLYSEFTGEKRQLCIRWVAQASPHTNKYFMGMPSCFGADGLVNLDGAQFKLVSEGREKAQIEIVRPFAFPALTFKVVGL